LEKWFIYIIETKSKRLYTGITKDLAARLDKHKSGKGAKFFRTDPPIKIVYSEEVDSKSEALKREYAIKQFTKAQKLDLIKC
jgi:putative endonuclease